MTQTRPMPSYLTDAAYALARRSVLPQVRAELRSALAQSLLTTSAAPPPTRPPAAAAADALVLEHRSAHRAAYALTLPVFEAEVEAAALACSATRSSFINAARSTS